MHEIKDELMKFITLQFYRGGRKIRNKAVLHEAAEISKRHHANNPTNNAFHCKTEKAQSKMIERFMTTVRAEVLLQPRARSSNNSRTPHTTINPCKSYGEGEECLDVCRRKDNCPYKRMVNKTFKRVIKKEKHGKGTCLILEEDCAKGDFVIEYFGRKVPEKTLERNGGHGTYYMKVGKNTIDGNITTKNDAKYINHSCRPNCVPCVREINGKSRVFIFTTKKINKNTELTFDYCWTVETEEDRTRCRCSAGKYCRRYMEVCVKK